MGKLRCGAKYGPPLLAAPHHLWQFALEGNQITLTPLRASGEKSGDPTQVLTRSEEVSKLQVGVSRKHGDGGPNRLKTVHRGIGYRTLESSG